MANCEHKNSNWLPRGLMSLIIFPVFLLPAMDALAWKSGFPLSIASPTLEVDGSWDLYEDDIHIFSQDGSRNMFRRCSGDRDKPTCLTFLRRKGYAPEPVVVCNPKLTSNQVPLGFSRQGLLIWDASWATVYSLGVDNRCKELTHDAWIPVLAPDGERIAYLTSFVSGGANLFIYNFGNGRTTQLTRFPRKKMPVGHMWWTREGERTGFVDYDGRKFWLPDRDERLVFEVQDDDGFGGTPVETWTVRHDGSGLQKIADSQLSLFVGWSDETGHRHTETAQQRAIVLNAMNHSEDSPQSMATGSNVVWETDTKDGDGQRMRDAIQVVYDYWVRSGRPALPFVEQLPITVQDKMRARLRETYSPTEQSAFIAQISSVFNGTMPPVTDKDKNENETLQYLGIRAQCKEFADRIVHAGGGKTHTYSEGKALAVKPKDIRPGMYAFKKDSSHAAIIIAVKWDANGQATDLRLAEANMGPGWTNPKGQVPWKRGVTTREVPVSEFFVVPTD